MSNILKGLTESNYRNYDTNRTGFSRGPRDDERHDLDVQQPSQQQWALKINGKVWSKDGNAVTFNSKEQALKARQSLLAKRPELDVGLVTRGGVAEQQLDELSPETLASYKKKAGASATQADKQGNYKLGDKRMSGIVRATKKEFDNDTKQVKEDEEELDENLHKWFKEKWVRFGPDGKIRGDCARGDDSEGKPKCLPQSKAHNLGKKGRASAAARKRREDPNPERSGKAINVNTKKKSNESVVIGRDEGNFVGDTPVNLGGVVVKNLGIGDIVSYLGQKAKILAMSKTGNTSRIHIPSSMGGVTKDVLTKDLKRTSLSEEELDEACWKGYHKEGNKKMFGKTYPNCVKNTNEEQELNEFATDGFNGGDDGEEFSPEMAKMAQEDGFTKGAGLADGATLERAMAINDWDKHDGGIYSQHFAKGFIAGRKDKIRHNNKQYNLNLKLMKDGSIRHGEQGVAEGEVKQFPKKHRGDLEDTHSCIKCGGDLQGGTYMGHKVKVCMPCKQVYLPPNTGIDQRGNKVDEQSVTEEHHSESCPHCGGEMVSEELMNEKKDACYYKVKSRYKVWPSAYASGALVKCRKKGADSWGNGGKSNESIEEDDAGDVEQRMIAKIAKEKQRLAKLKQTDPEAYKREMAKSKTSSGVPPVSTFEGLDWLDDRAAKNIHKLKRDHSKDKKVRPAPAQQDGEDWEQRQIEKMKKYRSPEQGVAEMDSQGYKGTRDDYELGKGKEHTGKSITTDNMLKAAKKVWDYATEPVDAPDMATYKRNRAKNIANIRKNKGVAEDQLDEKWTKKYKDSINCSNPKGFSQKAHCAGKQKNESAIMSGLNQLDEGWKEKLGAAALAGSMALGAGGANARVTPDGQGGFTGGLKPTATVTAPSDNKPSAEAPKGFSKEYLQKAADPNRTGKYMISVEKAQELLKNMP